MVTEELYIYIYINLYICHFLICHLNGFTDTFISCKFHQYDLVCDRAYLRSSYSSIYMVGAMVGALFIGYLADGYDICDLNNTKSTKINTSEQKRFI